MMNSHKRLAFMFLVLAMPVSIQAQALEAGQEKPKPALPNYVELSSHIGIGGQPTDAGMKELAEKGYKIIINLRTSGEGVDLAAEERQAMQLGLRYYMVPLSGKEPTEEQALAFNALMSALKGDKVFVHCGIGARAGSLMMIYLVLEEGMPQDKAEQEAQKAGLRSPDLLEFARQVIRNRGRASKMQIPVSGSDLTRSIGMPVCPFRPTPIWQYDARIAGAS